MAPGQVSSEFRGNIDPMDPRAASPAARLLRTLSLLQTRPRWTATELAERLGTTDRTVRRDIARLRELGYPVESDAGRTGGYRLGIGGALPPLLLTDDEAVAVAVGLRAAAERGIDGFADAATSALTKVHGVLPPHVRERVRALDDAAMLVRDDDTPGVDPQTLLTVAQACRRAERLTFAYRDGNGKETERRVEPYGLVNVDRRWYVVVRDLDRVAWRTFRLDRMRAARGTGHEFVRGEAPDPTKLVLDGLAMGAYAWQAVVLLHADLPQAAAEIRPTVGVLEPAEGGTVLRLGGDSLDWIARYVAGLPFAFEVREPPELRDALRALAARLID